LCNTTQITTSTPFYNLRIDELFVNNFKITVEHKIVICKTDAKISGITNGGRETGALPPEAAGEGCETASPRKIIALQG